MLNYNLVPYFKAAYLFFISVIFNFPRYQDLDKINFTRVKNIKCLVRAQIKQNNREIVNFFILVSCTLEKSENTVKIKFSKRKKYDC